MSLKFFQFHSFHEFIFFFTLALAEISWTPLFAASLMMGVMRPLSVATAIDMWIESRARGPSPDQVTFTSGISYDKKSAVSSCSEQIIIRKNKKSRNKSLAQVSQCLQGCGDRNPSLMLYLQIVSVSYII